MPPIPLPGGPVRSASVVNAEIRALWSRGPLSRAEADRYEDLLAEWAAAVRAEVERAA